MARSFIISYDSTRTEETVLVTTSFAVTVPSGSVSLLATVTVDGAAYFATVPSGSGEITRYYPIIEQQNTCISLKNTFVPYILTIG